ncbi:FecR domain-containing protein [Candidatus Woesearchaeota archaeon]|nr:FecR domain-containing protein [Candidatus Woesearchaeota archaeon]
MEKTQAPKKSKKGLVIGIIVLLVLAGAGYAFYAVTGSSTVKAQVHVESGSVSVNGATAAGTVKLSEGDVITTGSDGKATVVLYESTLISLEPDSQVTLDELTKSHPKVSQEGTTWTMFTKLAGAEAFSAKAGSTVASVRGTVFELSDGFIMTGEGTVTYNMEGQTFTVKTGQVVEDGVARDATPEELASMTGFMNRAVGELKHMRQLEIDKHPTTYAMVKSMYGVDDAFIQNKLAEADAGMFNVDEFVLKSPVQMDSVDKIADITKTIQKVNEDIESMQ